MSINLDLPQLKRLLSIPTAPFCEKQIKSFFYAYLGHNKVPYFEDTYGNLVVGAGSPTEYRKKLRKNKTALKVIVAHMDHPGFHGKKWQNSQRQQMTVDWFGGSPTADLRGARVWLSSDKTPEEFFYGTLLAPKMNKRKTALKSGVVRLEKKNQLRLQALKPNEIYGGFGFREPCWQKGKILYTKAADDLIGAFSVVSIAADLYRSKSRDRDHFIGLLTRAEEVGFIGMIEHLDRGYLKSAAREVVVLSLEASRTLDRAKIGEGPVVRLGDATGVFDPIWGQILKATAEKTLKKRFQKRIMDGGSCEATPAIAYGLKAVGISVPLGNYHNMNFQGGPDASKSEKGPAPEFVNIDDVRGQIRLARAFVAASSQKDPFGAMKGRFKTWMREYSKLR